MIIDANGKRPFEIRDSTGKEFKKIYDADGNLLFKNWNTIQGTPPIVFKGYNKTLKNYKIYGNTIQDGTPTPDNPVEVQGCGERTENLAPPYSDLVSGYVSSAGGISSANSPYNEKSSMFFSVSPNTTYTFSFRDGLFPTDGIESRWHAVGYYGADYQFIIRYKGAQGKPLITTTPSEARYARISYRSFNTTQNTMFVEGSTSPDHYIPYGYKIPVTVSDGTTTVTTPVYIGSEPLHKIDGYTDHIDFERGMVVRNIKKIVLTGDEKWLDNMHNTNQNVYRVENFANFRIFSTSVGDAGIFRCNQILYMQPPYPSGLYDRAVLMHDKNHPYSLYFSTKTSMNLDTVTSFKNFLAEQCELGKPVTIWYIVAEPEEEQLENPSPIQTIKGTNILSANTTIQPSEIYLKGKIKSLTTHTD